MDEEDFDRLMPFRPFGTDDALRAEAQARRSTALGIALWGKTPDDLHRQLLAPHPEIPSGFDLDDLRELQKNIRTIAAGLGDPRLKGLASLTAIRALYSPVIVIGTQRLTALEARWEIVRRAIEYLENR
jgi:hypothetical protein